tara:strand:+ start:96 stop:815 length:720 start_codon:yes stop_codon:yes gene_type:complete
LALIRGIKKKDYEKLTDVNIKKVIELLEQTSPITKKEACEILNIRYNTTRLQRIIEEYNDTQEHKERRKSQNRGKGATKAEIKQVIEEYLEGDNILSISKRLYRSPSFVKAIIDRTGIPHKLPKSYNRNRDILLPEECIAESFEEGERVWAARENAPAKVVKEHNPAYQATMPGLQECDYEKKYGSKGYQIYVYEEFKGTEDFHYAYGLLVKGQAGYYSFSLAYDLGSLKHLEKYGVFL